jgi:hypothetical protein
MLKKRILNIRDYVKINFINKPFPYPNYKFINKYILRFNNNLFGRLNYDHSVFNVWMDYNLKIFKNNSIYKNKKYHFYFLNTPNNFLLFRITNMIEIFYSLHKQKDYRDTPRYVKEYNSEFKYDLISLWHKLGKEIYLYYFNCLFELYTLHFIEIAINNYEYKKFKIILPHKTLELDYYLSYTEFKNLIITEMGEFLVEDYIEYGKDLYNFIIYYIFIYNLKNIPNSLNNNNSLIIRELAEIQILGPFYKNKLSSKNYINSCIVNINWDYKYYNPCNIHYMPQKPIKLGWFKHYNELILINKNYINLKNK